MPGMASAGAFRRSTKSTTNLWSAGGGSCSRSWVDQEENERKKERVVYSTSLPLLLRPYSLFHLFSFLASPRGDFSLTNILTWAWSSRRKTGSGGVDQSYFCPGRLVQGIPPPPPRAWVTGK